MLLEIDRLCKRYGGVRALDDVSLSIESGTVLGLLGDNGAGKSTLLKCVTGSEIPDSGTLNFNGQLLARSDPHASRLAGIEMIYQDLNLCPQQYVVTNIYLGRELRRNLLGLNLPLLDIKGMRDSVLALLASLLISANRSDTFQAASNRPWL